MQRGIGNRALHRLLRSSIQPKLTVGPAHDEYEREADRVADAVTRMPDPAVNRLQRSPIVVQRMCAECEEEQLQRMCAECEEEQRHSPQIQSKTTSPDVPEVSPSLGSYLAATRGDGAPLSPAARAFFEPRFGQDFRDVRVHTDERAAEASSEISARAFTAGSDIYFARSQYSPGSRAGDRLLGHELTHVLQQSHRGSIQPLRRKKSSVGEDYSRGNDDQFECCYETAAIKVALELDDTRCTRDKNAKVPATVVYDAWLGGKTEEPGGQPSTDPTTEGKEHFLTEKGKPKNTVKLIATTSKAGTRLRARITVQNDTTCGGSKEDSGCVVVSGPRGDQQEIKWTAAGKVAKKIEAVQLPQKQDDLSNRLPSGLPLLSKGGYPSFATARPRHKDCWCDPKTGYHLNYSDKPKCPDKYRLGGNQELEESPAARDIQKTKPRPKNLPPVCETPANTKPICGE